MKNRLVAAVILILPLVLFYFFWAYPGAVKTERPGQPTNSPDAVLAHALATAPTQAVAVIASNFAAPAQTVFYDTPVKPPIAPAGKPQPPEFTNLAPELVLESLRHTIHDYASMFGGNPVGLNSEITSQLSGQNTKHANFIQPEAGMRVDDRGELVDPWGTPYFFHQLSAHEMEIRSAGPDRIMYTADDLVTE